MPRCHKRTDAQQRKHLNHVSTLMPPSMQDRDPPSETGLPSRNGLARHTDSRSHKRSGLRLHAFAGQMHCAREKHHAPLAQTSLLSSQANCWPTSSPWLSTALYASQSAHPRAGGQFHTSTQVTHVTITVKSGSPTRLSSAFRWRP